ncbi:MAG: ABC transporter ATP-binding protein [Anaerolineales bacterium]|nr:ABC transporter ATP-binding protein [Anaerolineales bacterium]
MSETIIRVENLSKRYRIGGKQESYGSLRESLLEATRAPFRRLASWVRRDSQQARNEDSWIWALKDVSFEVEQGEVLGVIGRNGAGKSTLLKILARITRPTEGKVTLCGRVGSLLEVGVGFHPELTGRENIHLSGAILGMRRVEINRKFDEIVHFAEIEKFLDTPVKRYSSGMYVRLAFAVAAHLEPEILLVDEVLAVGDVAFQRKCLGKMGEVAKEGRTVLFVSHNMGAVRKLCNRAILLAEGQLCQDGDVSNTIDKYLEGAFENNVESSSLSRPGYIKRIELLNSVLERRDTLLAGDGGIFRIYYDTGRVDLTNVGVTIALYTLMGVKVATFSTWDTYEYQTISKLNGKGYIDCRFDEFALSPGSYRVNVAFDGLKDAHRFHEGVVNGCELAILPSEHFGSTRIQSNESGFVLVKHRWLVN